MTRFFHPSDARLTAVALALLAAFGPARAQVADVQEANVSAGVLLISGDSADRAQFGQYNGLRNVGNVWPTLDFDFYRHQQADDTTLKVQGTNLTLHTRELGLRWKRQSDWKIGLDYNEGVRYDPNTVYTGLQGAGSATPQVVPTPAGTGAELDMRLKRTSLGLSAWKSLANNLDLEFSLKTEDKQGSRLFGIGFNCPSTTAPGCRGTTGTNVGSAVLMLPEPVDANHTQVEARLSYADDKWRVSGGYYGSFYNNRLNTLTPGVPGSLYNPVGTLLPLSSGLQSILSQPVALPPDNEAHQLDLTGGYAFSRTTQLSFKLAWAQALQHEDFAGSGFSAAPAGVSNLGGRLTTTLVQVGLNARPTPKLTIYGDLRYEDRDDETPIALYNLEGTATYTNRQLPNRKTRGKLQGAYQFAPEYRGLLVGTYESIDRGVFTATSAVAGISALRQNTDEGTLRAELQRTMSETFTASIALEGSRRDGSNWLKPNSGTGVTEVPDPSVPGSGLNSTSIYMPTLADRDRNKLQLRANWQPQENLSLQFNADTGKDRYKVPSPQGLQDSNMNLVAVDFDYAWTESWSFNGWFSQGRQSLNQARAAGYIMAFRNTNTAYGLGVVGRPSGKVEVGANLSYIEDRNVYTQSLDAFAPPDSVALLATTGGLPDVMFRQGNLKLYGKYAVDKASSVRLDFWYQHSKLSDWTWGYSGVPFTYSDGTTVGQKPDQKVGLIGMSYIYQWR